MLFEVQWLDYTGKLQHIKTRDLGKMKMKLTIENDSYLLSLVHLHARIGFWYIQEIYKHNCASESKLGTDQCIRTLFYKQ